MKRPTTADVLARANEIAKKRYPNGAAATILADIVREAARDLGLTKARIEPPEKALSPFAGRHNDMQRLSAEMQSLARQACYERCGGSCMDANPLFVCYGCQDIAASRIETRSAIDAKRRGPKGESLTAESGDAQGQSRD